MTVGSFVFVHGGLSYDLANKYTIAEINNVVSKWMCKNNNKTEEDIFDEILETMMICHLFGVEFLEKMMMKILKEIQ